jgi:hypothetical protein
MFPQAKRYVIILNQINGAETQIINHVKLSKPNWKSILQTLLYNNNKKKWRNAKSSQRQNWRFGFQLHKNKPWQFKRSPVTPMRALTFLLNEEVSHDTNLQASWVCSKYVWNLLFHIFILFKHKCHALFKNESRNNTNKHTTYMNKHMTFMLKQCARH